MQMPVFLLIRPFSSSGYSLSLQLSLYKNVIDRADCIFEVFIADTDDNIQLTGSLVDHLDINPRVRQRCKNTSCSTTVCPHATSYDCDQSQPGFKIKRIRLYGTVNSGDHILLLLHELRLMNDNGKRIDSGRHMLKGNAVLLKYLQHLSSKTDLGVHLIFFDIDRTEALLTRNSGDRKPRLAAGALHDQSTRILRTVCIFNIDRNTFLAEREDRICMQYGRSHIGKLAQFPVRDRLDRLRILYDVRIGHQET